LVAIKNRPEFAGAARRIAPAWPDAKILLPFLAFSWLTNARIGAGKFYPGRTS
jgi:hypothetical protein